MTNGSTAIERRFVSASADSVSDRLSASGGGVSVSATGSAAGVALMGTARGYYTFFSHLKWTWAIALGYIASIYAHLWINSHLL